MEHSRSRDAWRAVLLLGGVALGGALLVAARVMPAADLGAPGIGPISDLLGAGLIVVASAAAVAAIVAGLRRGRLAALLGSGAAAAIAAGAVARASGADGVVGGLPVGAALLAAAAAADRAGTLVGGQRARLAVVAGALVFGGAGVVLAMLPAASELAAGLRVPLLGTAAVVALAVGIVSPRLAAVGALAAAGAFGFLVARPGGLESLLGVAALAGAQLEALRLMSAEAGRPAAVDGGSRLPPLADHLADAVLHFDGRLQLVDWNPTASSLLGLDDGSRGARLEDLLGVALPSLPPADGTAAVVSGVAALEIGLHRSGDGVTAVVRDRRTDDDADRLARELRGTLEELLRARRTIDLQRDELERSATVDLLTGVASRSAILDRLRVEIAQARRYQHPVAVLMVDVDDFAGINRRHGVAGGDALLREVALRMRLRVREADALGRAGSDGFLALLPHTDEDGAATFAAALRRRISQRPVLLDEELLEVTVSVGVAVVLPGEELDLDAVLARATEALDSARRAGGDRIALDRLHGLARLDERRPGRERRHRPTAQDSGS